MLSGAAAYYFRGARLTADADAASQEAQQTTALEPAADPMDDLTPIDLLELQVGYGLIAMVDSERDGELLERIKTVRRQIAQDLGVIGAAPAHSRQSRAEARGVHDADQRR